MDKYRKKKREQLGVDPGTASSRLRKILLFKFVQLADEDVCYQCGKKIRSLDEFSIEHMEPWLDSDNPSERFFDLNNIAYSHLACNVGAGRKAHKIQWPKDQAWCPNCKLMRLLKEFPDSKPIKRNVRCRQCSRNLWHEKGYAQRRQERRNKQG